MKISTAFFGALAVAALTTGCASTSAAPGGTDSRQPASLQDGFFIRTYADGSGSVALGSDILSSNWSIDCGIDPMNDKRDCSFYGPSRSTDERYGTSKGNLFVNYGAAGTPQWVCIMEHDFPGRTGQIRVDTNAPLTTDRDGCVRASAILAQLKVGSLVTTRRVTWPYDYAADNQFSLAGFNKVLEVVDGIRAQ